MTQIIPATLKDDFTIITLALAFDYVSVSISPLGGVINNSFQSNEC